MKVSIVIPTYNRAYILGDAVESALAQTYQNVEIIIVDDGSTDDTREIVESYHSDKIRYIGHESNRGCSAAYNTGIRASSGSFICFLDSDDLWTPDYVRRHMDFFRRHPEADVVFADTEIVGGPTRIPSLMVFMPCFRALLKRKRETEEYLLSGREIYLCLLSEIPIKPSATVIRREKLDCVGGFDEAWPSGTDWDLLLRLSKLSWFGYIDRPMTIQRRTPDATHQRFREKDKLFLIRVFLREKATLLGDAQALKQINRGICNHYNSLAWMYLQMGCGKKALATYYRGLRETRQLWMLRKLASAVLRLGLGMVRERSFLQVPEGRDLEMKGASVKPQVSGLPTTREQASARRCPAPAVSIVVPSFNRGYIIGEAIESALSQEYTDFELIVVDDGSTDGTRAVVESFKDERIRYVLHNHNLGYSAACNTGILRARGQYVAFLDSDDVWKADYLERQICFLTRHPEIDVAFCDAEIRHELTVIPSLVSLMRCFPKLLQDAPGAVEHTFSRRQMYLCLLEEVPIKPTGTVIRCDALKRVGGFDESWPSGTDWDIFLRLSHAGRFGYIDAPLVVQRRTNDATHQKFREQDKLFLLSLFLNEKASVRGDREAIRAVNRGLTSHYNSVAWHYLEGKRRWDALSVYLSGFAHTWNPMMLMKAAASAMPTRVRTAIRTVVRLRRDKFAIADGSRS